MDNNSHLLDKEKLFLQLRFSQSGKVWLPTLNAKLKVRIKDRLQKSEVTFMKEMTKINIHQRAFNSSLTLCRYILKTISCHNHKNSNYPIK